MQLVVLLAKMPYLELYHKFSSYIFEEIPVPVPKFCWPIGQLGVSLWCATIAFKLIFMETNSQFTKCSMETTRTHSTTVNSAYSTDITISSMFQRYSSADIFKIKNMTVTLNTTPIWFSRQNYRRMFVKELFLIGIGLVPRMLLFIVSQIVSTLCLTETEKRLTRNQVWRQVPPLYSYHSFHSCFYPSENNHGTIVGTVDEFYPIFKSYQITEDTVSLSNVNTNIYILIIWWPIKPQFVYLYVTPFTCKRKKSLIIQSAFCLTAIYTRVDLKQIT